MNDLTTPVDAIISTHFPADHISRLAEETKDEIINKQSNDIVELKSNLDSMTKNWEFQRDAASIMRARIKDFGDSLKEHVSEESIDSDIAQMYADIFDIPLTKKYDVSVTVTFSGTAEVPLGMDEDSITHNVSFSFDEGWSDGVEWDMTEDDIDWDIQEAY